jgi:hypothetical protein
MMISWRIISPCRFEPWYAHQAFHDVAPFRVGHSDNSSPAHSNKLPLSVLAFKRLRAQIRCACFASWEYRSKATVVLWLAMRGVAHRDRGELLSKRRACGPQAVKAETSGGGLYPRSSSAALRADPLAPRGPAGG